jgi:RHS repeat-associated protein
VFNAATVDSLIRRTYAYDSLGRIVSEQRPVQAATETEVRNYAYDGVGQLRRYEWSEAASECTPKDGYGCEPSAGQVFQLLGLEYDPALNMFRQIDSTSGNVVTPTSFDTPNRLTGWGNVTYQYDADGNRVLRRDNNTGIETIYAWSADGRLLSVQRGSTTLAYDYNAFGELVRRRANGAVDRHFIWDEGHLLAELNGTASSKTAEYAYYPGVDRPLALITGASGSMVRYYHQDERGNVIGLTSGTSVAQHNVYNPWGQLEAQIDMLPDTSRLGWKGLMREGGITNLYYARARWYDPESRRFMSEDPIGLAGGLNLYAMADNDPVNKSDPTGLDAEPGGCQYTTVGGRLDSWDFSGCGGGGLSVSYIAVLLMAMDEPPFPSPAQPQERTISPSRSSLSQVKQAQCTAKKGEMAMAWAEDMVSLTGAGLAWKAYKAGKLTKLVWHAGKRIRRLRNPGKAIMGASADAGGGVLLGAFTSTYTGEVYGLGDALLSFVPIVNGIVATYEAWNACQAN